MRERKRERGEKKRKIKEKRLRLYWTRSHMDEDCAEINRQRMV